MKSSQNGRELRLLPKIRLLSLQALVTDGSVVAQPHVEILIGQERSGSPSLLDLASMSP